MVKSTKKPKTTLNKKTNTVDITFLFIILILVSLGLVMLFSASYANAYYRNGDSFHYIKDQAIFAIIGLCAMFIISKIDYRILHKLAYIILGISVVLLIIVLFMKPLNNARRWIILPGLGTFQPSEIAKFSVIVVFSHWISTHYSKMKTFKYGVLPFAGVIAVIGGLMVMQPHLSGTVLILLIGLTLMWVGGTNKKWFAFGGVAIVAVLLFVVFFTDMISYATHRLEYWIDPFSDALGKGYQTIQSLLAIGSGGFLGLGLGNSRQKYLYLPEPQNDFIFAIIAEELGFVGAVIIILLFIALLIRGFEIAMRARDKFGSLLAVGLTVQVAYQALLNIAVVSNTIPNTGISLPFFSYGGTSLILLLAQMGVVLSISRQSSITKD